MEPEQIKKVIFIHKMSSTKFVPTVFISTVKPTRCTNVSNLFYLEWHFTCFGRSFRPSSGVQDCTYSNRHLSNRYCCLLYFIMEWHSTYFGRSFRPSSGVQDYIQNRHLKKRILLSASKQTAVSVWQIEFNSIVNECKLK